MKKILTTLFITIFAIFGLAQVAFAADEVSVEESYTDSSGVIVSNDDTDADAEHSGVQLLGTTSNSVDSTSYTYKITPLLPPFNHYFFVKTDNPNPSTFRFADKDSVYSEEAEISLNWDSWYEKPILYADIRYENAETGRVNGGYIFYSADSNGGEVVLQEIDDPSAREPEWKDTSIKKTLPVLVDNVDYLINTYADKSSFFDNMSAVQSGFSSICLYSGSFVRGELIKPDNYWFVATAGHIDQSFYIYSPYDREDSQSLFATAIYPFRYDSLGFPNMMGKVAQRLDSSATYKANSSYHYLIDVTYNGQTKSYGGAGEGKGQGITEDKIQQYFTFGSSGSEITLASARSLLESYAALSIPDDIPREDELTWRHVYDAAGNGTWARVSGSNSKSGKKWNLTNSVYAFIYQKGDGQNLSGSEWSVGYSTYNGGDLGYARDAWVDGRYVNVWREYVPGETFENHPTSTIILCDVTVPQITYEQKYNSSLSETEYRNINITEELKTVAFKYSDGQWTAPREAFNSGCAQYDKIALFTEKGLIDEQYLDMVTITQDEIEALELDRNTDIAPDKGCIFDGLEAPGTLYDHAQGHCWNLGKITKQPGCRTTGETLFTCLVCGETKTETVPATGHKYPLIREAAQESTCITEGNTEYWYCTKCRKYFSDEDGNNEIKAYSWYLDYTDHQWDKGVITEKPTCMDYGVKTYTCKVCDDTRYEWLDPTDHQWKHVKVAAGLLKTGSEYDQCIYCKIKKNIKKRKGYAAFYVKGFKLSPAKAAFTAKWTKRSTAVQKKFNGYQIRYSTKSNMAGAKYATASKKSSSKKITKLKKKTKYYVQVRTYTISKKVKYYSKWSTKKAVRTK